MSEIRNIETNLRGLTDRELLEILDNPQRVQPRQLSLACMEADRRGGVTSVRARVQPLPRVLLKAIGYWKDTGKYRDCPEPHWLTWPAWAGEDLNSIVAYLAGGHTFKFYCGCAFCRFPGCGCCLGSKDLTDGEWVWPERLEHYIVQHSVSLPDAFRARMQQVAWVVPPVDTLFQHHPFDYDVTLWVDWCSKLWPAQRG